MLSCVTSIQNFPGNQAKETFSSERNKEKRKKEIIPVWVQGLKYETAVSNGKRERLGEEAPRVGGALDSKKTGEITEDQKQ